jgi:Selenoprotein, putative
MAVGSKENAVTGLRKLLGGLWEYLREASGENDYARSRARALEQGAEILSPGDFYEEKLREKYSRPNRCC